MRPSANSMTSLGMPVLTMAVVGIIMPMWKISSATLAIFLGVAAAVVVAFFGFEFWRAGDVLVRTGFALLIAGMVYVVWQLHARGSSKTLPRDAGLSSYVEFQRHELERQRDALERVRRWYLAPLVPGMAVLLMAFGLANPGHAKQIWLVVAIEALVMGAILFGIAKLNDAAARKLQDQIDELEDGGRQD